MHDSGQKKLGKFRTSARAAAKTDPMTINKMTFIAAEDIAAASAGKSISIKVEILRQAQDD